MIILTTIGTGDYSETKYQFEDKTSVTGLIQVALSEWYPQASIRILATNEAREKHGSKIEQVLPNAVIIPIPSGRTEDELWTLFNILADELPDGESVLLDITHGFRSLPQLALLSLAFLRVVKRIKIEAVLYGAYEAKTADGVCPIFDLTPFVNMLDWANATDRFLETGDARKITPLITLQERNPLNNVGRHITSLSEALLMNRADLIRKEAAALKNEIEKIRSLDFGPQFAPFRYIIDTAAQRVEPMAVPVALDAQIGQIEWLANHGHYPAAASLAREWLISLRVVCAGGAVFPVNSKQREAEKKWLNDRARTIAGANAPETSDVSTEVPTGDANTDEDTSEIAKWNSVIPYWRDVQDLRNDLMHFGMRKDPRRPIKIRDFMQDLPFKLRQLQRDVINGSQQ